jgi:hemerythrin-like domain-containing protein
MDNPLEQFYEEHRAISAVLHGMQYLVRQHKERDKPIDPKVLRAMLYYLDVFPEREHHPKEETILFASLRKRTHEADEALDELARQHQGGEGAIRNLEQDLLRYESGGEAEFPAFAAAVERFVEGYWAHMRLEEHTIMPLARKHLTAEDWREAEHAFATRKDPLHGADALDPRALFSRIVSIAPPPIGLGPAV